MFRSGLATALLGSNLLTTNLEGDGAPERIRTSDLCLRSEHLLRKLQLRPDSSCHLYSALALLASPHIRTKQS